MSLGDRRRTPRAVIVLCLAAALVACLGTGSILAASTPGPSTAQLAKKKCAKKRGKAKKRCQKHAAKPPAPTVTLTVASNLPGAGTINSSPNGISCGTVCTAKFAPGTPVHLSATDASGYFQVDWTGGGCSSRGACDLVLSSDTTVVAGFLERVTVTGTAGGNGTVEALATAAPYGVCTGGTCTVNSGDDVTLTAVPDSGHVFGGWSGDCTGDELIFTFTSVAAPEKACTATFIPLVPLTVDFYGDGIGSVTSSPAGIDCGPTCTASFPAGTVVTLNPAPADGSVLAGWFGACEGIGAIPCTLTLGGPTTATVYFAGPDPGGPPD